MDANLSVAWGLMLVAKAIWILIIPVVVVIAAAKLWHSCPRWIPVVFLTSAVVSVAASAPQLLLVLHKITSQQYGQIAIPLVLASGVLRIASAAALLALACRMKRMTEHQNAELSPAAVAPDEA